MTSLRTTKPAEPQHLPHKHQSNTRMGIPMSKRRTSQPRVIKVNPVNPVQVDSVPQQRHRHSVSICYTSPPPSRSTQRTQSGNFVPGPNGVLPDKEFLVTFFHSYEERESLTSLDRCLLSESLHTSKRPKQIQWLIKPVDNNNKNNNNNNRHNSDSFSVVKLTTVGHSFHRVVGREEASSVEVSLDQRSGVTRAKMTVTFDDKDKGKVACKLVLQIDIPREDAEQGWILTGKMYQDSGRSWQAYVAKAKLMINSTKEVKKASLREPIIEEERTPRRISVK